MLSAGYNYMMNCYMVFHKKETVRTAVKYLFLAGIWGVNYLIPQKGIQAKTVLASSDKNISDSRKNANTKEQPIADKEQQITDKEQKIQGLLETGNDGMQVTKVNLDTQDWHRKFADKFTNQVVSTDTTYTSPNLSI